MTAAAGVLINEIRVNAVGGAGAQFIANWLQRRHHLILDATLGGCLIWVPCDTIGDAEDTRDMLWRFMVPTVAMAACTVDKDGNIPRHRLRQVGYRTPTAPIPVREP